ncbi:hypothetical protein [Pseudooceanicola sp. LIPI14-2-Ac024]|uniref:hypothetical protein n=1 Tax=Pseudooceanicola sp. LIPI14-2-Ac024 TaxID=3344875 RepID=UPI0035CF68D7
MPTEYGVSAPEALIYAGSQKKADEILAHINAAMLLYNGYTAFERDDIHVKEDTLSTLPHSFVNESPYANTSRLAASGVVDSCKYVANTWNMENIRLALARLFHSTYLAYFHPLDASPSYGDFADFDTSLFPLMAYALAITAAYSAIEELGCEPASTRRGEAILIGNKWNHNVSEELKTRLASHGIDPFEQIIWMSRGRKNLISAKYSPGEGKLADWNRARVRDRIIPLYEGILLSSRIRHRVAAHNTKRETKALTPVDLMNVQSVCRHLLMAFGGTPVSNRRMGGESALEFRRTSVCSE